MSGKRKFHYAFVVLLALSLIRGFAGPAINGSSGLFLTPVSKEIGVGIGQLSLYLSISSVITLIWLPIAGSLYNKLSSKMTAILGILLQAPAFLALGYMNSVWGWYILSVPLAMGSVLLVNLLGPVLVNRWFARNQGMIMGIMMTITSLMGALFQPLLSNMITTKGWRNTYISFGLLALISMILLSLLFLKDRPETMHLLPYGSAPTPSQTSQSPSSFPSTQTQHSPLSSQTTQATPNTPSSHSSPPSHTPIPAGLTTAQALRSPVFYLLLIYMIVLTGFAAFSQHITTYGLDIGFTMVKIGKALSLSMIGSAIGSLLVGYFSDRIGIVTTCIAVMATGLLSILLFLLGGHQSLLFDTASFLHGLATSSIGVVAPLLTSTFFGQHNYEKLFSLIMMGSPLASIILLPAYGFIYDTFGSYQIVFLFLICALIAGAISLWLASRSAKQTASH